MTVFILNNNQCQCLTVLSDSLTDFINPAVKNKRNLFTRSDE